jgi:hypothetical protein
MSTLNVDKVDPSTGTDLELGSSGDTITVPSGATIVNSGTATGFGAALTGSTNNTVATVTGANALAGEANLTFDGTDLTVSTGDIIIGTAGKGIDFSAQTTSSVTGATATAEILDHYEEGSWTPTWVFGTSGSCTAYNNTGYYVRTGGNVTAWGFIAQNVPSSPSGTVYIGGLPFTPINGYGHSSGFYGQCWVSGSWGWGGNPGIEAPVGGTLRSDATIELYRRTQYSTTYVGGTANMTASGSNYFVTDNTNYCQAYFGVTYLA